MPDNRFFNPPIPPHQPRKVTMPIAPAPPMALGSAPEAYSGDNIYINFDGRLFWLRTGLVNIPMSMATIETINAYVRMVTGEPEKAEYNVYCEETKKHHRAILLRELTLDEIYKGLK